MTITRAELKSLFGMAEPGLEPISSKSQEADGYTIETLRFKMEGVGLVRALLTRPSGTVGRLPAILYAHAHGDNLALGASELIEGRKELLSPLGSVLAAAGYVTLCLEMPIFGERSGVTESAATKARIWYGKSLVGQMLSEQAAALSYLATREDVDPARIGMFGLSLGATLTYWLAAVDPRIASIAHLCCYADYATLVELGAHDHHGVYLLVPGMLNKTSTGEIAGLVAPRPQLICLGELDELTPPLSVDRALVETRALYAAAGAPEALEVYRQAGTLHQETAEMRAKVMAFFKCTL